MKTSKLRRVAVLLAFLAPLGLPAPPALAGEVQFMGRQGDRAHLRIERRTHLVAPGESVAGVRVLSVTRDAAVLRLDGRTLRYARGAKRGEELATRVAINRGRGGMFEVPGEINGVGVHFLVDTGASHVVLNAADARRLRIAFTLGRHIQVRTASRVEGAYEVRLESVRVEGIVRNDVPAIVTRGRMPDRPLLGMTFLRGLRMVQSGDALVLDQ